MPVPLKAPSSIAGYAQKSVAMALATLLLSGSALAQQDSSQPGSGLVIRATVRRVILDVVVTDSFGNPVRGLTRDDFAVAEDHATQRILSFEPHELGAAPATPVIPANLPTLPANTYLSLSSQPERGPLYIMLLDLVNTDPPDQVTVRAEISKFVQSKPAGTRFALFVLADELRLVQGFTPDASLLYAALDVHHPNSHVPMVFLYGANHGRHETNLMLQVFEHISSFVDGLPGRKNIIWVSGTFPLRLFPTDDDGPLYKERIRKMLDNMARNQVSIYPVDARGVVVEEGYAPGGSASGGTATGTSSSSGMGRVFSGSAAGGASSRPATASASVGASELMDDYQTQDEIARLTGGHAFHSNNNVAGELAEATDRGAAYYELSYAPTNRNYNGALRNIEVKLAKKGYTLDYRRNYYGNEDGQSPIRYASAPTPRSGSNGASARVRPVGDSLDVEMQYGAPMAHDLLFKAHVRAIGEPTMGTPEQMANLADQPAYFKVRKKNRPAKPLAPIKLQSFSIEYTLPASRSATQDDANPRAALEVAAAAFDADGRMLNGSVEDAFEPSPAEATTASQQNNGAAPSKGFYRIEQQFDAPLSATVIRIAVRDTATNRLGTIEVPLPLAPEQDQASASTR